MRDVAAAPFTPAPSMIPTSTMRHSTLREIHRIGRTMTASYSYSPYHFLLSPLPSPVSAGADLAGASAERASTRSAVTMPMMAIATAMPSNVHFLSHATSG